jgi:predicted MPP superfamily phosphohydrolase
LPRTLSARRLLKRRELITLALNGRESELPPAGLSPDPELTETDIWLRRLPVGFDGLRIVHLTDIHHSLFTPLEDIERAVHLANRLRPDLIALTGDYITLSSSYIWPAARALGKLRARLGVFAVLGNHDFQVGAEEITRALRVQRIRVLRNAHFALRARSATLWMVGVDDLWWGADDLPAALRAVPARDPRILLCHNPIGIRQAAEYGIDFVLSGHTHGGQLRLPVVGSLYGRSKLGTRFVEGWNRLDGTQIYVSRGIGKVLLPVRLGCPPEIACLRLRRT